MVERSYSNQGGEAFDVFAPFPSSSLDSCSRLWLRHVMRLAFGMSALERRR